MALRRADGFKRYALSVQYHGGSFLGFSYQNQEDSILPDGTDLRGFRSVEGRIRQALTDVFRSSNNDSDSHAPWENMQVSSRTDRGVHALKNTFHVDIWATELDHGSKVLSKLQKGLNYHLSRQTTSWSAAVGNDTTRNGPKRRRTSNRTSSHYSVFGAQGWKRHSIGDEVRILAAKSAPDLMENPYSATDPSQPPEVDWNARFSATERTYIYRILYFGGHEMGGSNTGSDEWGVPFEWDRSWRLRDAGQYINIHAMQQAATMLQGTHDFTSFRGAKCQRSSPVVTLKSVSVFSQPFGPPQMWGLDPAGLLNMGGGGKEQIEFPQLVTVMIVGNAFLYRQVRNIVGCLAEVGRNKLRPEEVRDILEAKSRAVAPAMAPPHGLYLVDVKHGNFAI